MDGFLDAFKPVLDAVGVQPWMYPLLFAFGFAHQFLKGSLRGWTSSLSVLSAAGLATVFGALSWAQHRLPPVEGGLCIVTLFASALIAEAAADKLAGAVPWLPKNNEWAKPAPPPETKESP